MHDSFANGIYLSPRRRIEQAAHFLASDKVMQWFAVDPAFSADLQDRQHPGIHWHEHPVVTMARQFLAGDMDYSTAADVLKHYKPALDRAAADHEIHQTADEFCRDPSLISEISQQAGIFLEAVLELHRTPKRPQRVNSHRAFP